MPTNLLFAFYILMAIIGVIATVLGIINWIMYSSTSSAITELNDELEKKGREFDTIKSEISSNQHSLPEQENAQYPQENVQPPENNTNLPVAEENIPEIISPSEETPSAEESPQIDIVRNVRGEYENPTSGVMKRETVIMKIKNSDEENDSASEEQQNQNASETENFTKQVEPEPLTEYKTAEEIQFSDDTIIDNPKSDSLPHLSLERNVVDDEIVPSGPSEILDVISEPEDPNKIGNDEIHGITVPLFSKAQNDADFNAMWLTVQKIIDDAIIPVQINVDFTNIFFLYGEEMEYLRKVYKDVKLKNCTIGFTNCSPELVKILWEDNELGNLILDI